MIQNDLARDPHHACAKSLAASLEGHDPLRHHDRHARPENLGQSGDRAVRARRRQRARRMPHRLWQRPASARARDAGGSDAGTAGGVNNLDNFCIECKRRTSGRLLDICTEKRTVRTRQHCGRLAKSFARYCLAQEMLRLASVEAIASKAAAVQLCGVPLSPAGN
jgi:hypothetical protein